MAPETPTAPDKRGASWMERIGEMRVGTYLDKWRARFHTDPHTGLPLRPLRPWIYADESLSIERLAFRTGRGLHLALKLYTPLTLALFVASFFWNPYGVVRSCSIAGLIGFGTNWVAIKMLFRPRESRPIFGQGLIPSQRDELIRKVADEVLDKLINERIIKEEIDESRLITRLTAETVGEVRRVMHDPEFVRDTKQLVLAFAAKLARSEAFRDEVVHEVEARVSRVVGGSLTGWIASGLRGVWREPLVRVVNSELDTLPETLDRLVGEIDEALNHIPSYLEQHQERIEAALTRVMMALVREMDVRSIVLKQLATVTSDQLETGFREFADDKLSYITLLGGLLGLVGGFVIVWPLASALVLSSLAVLLTLLDVLLYRLLRRYARRPSDAPST